MIEDELIRNYKDRLRIFLIIYFFSDPFIDSEQPHLKKLFTSEVRIQKIDFLIRNPDYLSFELLSRVKFGELDKYEVKDIVKTIFTNKEPILRRLEMERFFFGAYEDIDDVIAFLVSINFIKFSSKKDSNLKNRENKYYLTQFGIEKTERFFENQTVLSWYKDRCLLIKKYFGDLSGSQLKVSQYKIEEYRNTTYKDYIENIIDNVHEVYFELYNERLL